MKLLLACAVAMTAALPVSAQQLMATYDTQISQRDLVSSKGQRLGNFCSIVQQDRANYHRFGKRDGPDQGDPVFGDKVLRGRISNTCELEAGHGHLRDLILRGNFVGIMIRVRVLDDGGQLRVMVAERAG